MVVRPSAAGAPLDVPAVKSKPKEYAPTPKMPAVMPTLRPMPAMPGVFVGKKVKPEKPVTLEDVLAAEAKMKAAKAKPAAGAGAMPTRPLPPRRPLPPGMTPPEGAHTPMPARSMAAPKEKLSARKALSATDPRLHDPLFVRSATKPELLPSD